MQYQANNEAFHWHVNIIDNQMKKDKLFFANYKNVSWFFQQQHLNVQYKYFIVFVFVG